MKATLPLLLVSVLALSGCGHMCCEFLGERAKDGKIVVNEKTPRYTAPLKANVSAPVILGSYNKVASVSGTNLHFINLKNGDTVSNAVVVQFGLNGMGVEKAGIEKADTGHHHLLIDVAELDINVGIPVSDSHRHFGAGQTETLLTLNPGTHTLQLVLGDHNHIPHHPVVMSERITINVINYDPKSIPLKAKPL